MTVPLETIRLLVDDTPHPMDVFITGATGFIGRRVIQRLVTTGHTVHALCRRPDLKVDVEWVLGDLERPESYQPALSGVDAVIHLGALTGKALAARHDRVNRTATRSLHEAAREAGVPRFIFASTVAVRYPDKGKRPYVKAKEAAEKALREERPPTIVLRPTLVLGADSPIGNQLAQLARLPLTPVFGDGKTRLQPVHVDDVAEAFVDLAVSTDPGGATIEMGGPEELSLDELMMRFRAAAGTSSRPMAHFPVRWPRSMRGLLEPALLSMLPVTANQLDAFRYDSIAEKSSFVEARKSRLKTVEDMVRDTLAR